VSVAVTGPVQATAVIGGGNAIVPSDALTDWIVPTTPVVDEVG
jgi:hypothetical protein